MPNLAQLPKKEADDLKSFRVEDVRFDIEKSRIHFKNFRQNGISVYGHKRDGIFYAVVYRWAEKEDGTEICLEQIFPIASSFCYFGGERYWFVCSPPFHHCGKRVGVLYLKDGYLACRHCHNLTYSSKNADRSWEITYLRQIIILEKRLTKLKPQIKRSVYDGRITAKQRKYNSLYLKWKFANGFV